MLHSVLLLEPHFLLQDELSCPQARVSRLSIRCLVYRGQAKFLKWSPCRLCVPNPASQYNVRHHHYPQCSNVRRHHQILPPRTSLLPPIPILRLLRHETLLESVIQIFCHSLDLEPYRNRDQFQLVSLYDPKGMKQALEVARAPSRRFRASVVHWSGPK